MLNAPGRPSFCHGSERARSSKPRPPRGKSTPRLERLNQAEKLNLAGADESIESGIRQVELFRSQFPDEKTWQKALTSAGLTERALDARSQPSCATSTGSKRKSRGEFSLTRLRFGAISRNIVPILQEPLRLRASHLFLAAPDGYPAEVIETKRALIKQLSERLANGESFEALDSQALKTKRRRSAAGDLGYFAEARMLPAVFAAAQQLRPGATSAPIRSRLGFHILRLTESRPPRALTF